MQLASPQDTLAAALHHAAYVGLPDVVYDTRDFEVMRDWTQPEKLAASRGERPYPLKEVVRRPDVSECVVRAMFPQMWGSTALGFGGVGGQAMTLAYTAIIEGPCGHLMVYWNGRLAYSLDVTAVTDRQLKAFAQDLHAHTSAKASVAEERYGAQIPPR